MISLSHLTLHVTLAVGLFQRFSLILHLLSFAKTQQKFRSTSFEVKLERNQREAIVVCQACKLFDLQSVEQELSLPTLNVVHAVRFEVLLNVTTDQPDLAFPHASVSFLQRDMAVSQALHFAAMKDDAAFERIKYFIPMARFAILRYDFLVRIQCGAFFLFALFGHGISILRENPPLLQVATHPASHVVALSAIGGSAMIFVVERRKRASNQ